MTLTLPARSFTGSNPLVFLVVLFAIFVQARAATALADCLLPPAFDPGVGELYFCSPAEGERHLIEYARRSYSEQNLGEDIWINFRGVFADQVWVNVGTRETNDTSLPAWEAITTLAERMGAIKAGDKAALASFLAPLQATRASTEEERALKEKLLKSLRESAREPKSAPLRAGLYHVHLKPTREIEERSIMPINHMLSIPSHTDLLHAPRLTALLPGSESKIAVAAGMWTYNWEEKQGRGFVAERYDGPKNIPFPGEFGYVYSRFAITEYHRHGLNDPANVTPEKVAAFIATLKPTGALLRFDFAADWEAFRNSVAQAEQGK
ncbi:MAG: hypothetical protein HYW04_07485 [Deltaproteobacteria bacterium]|nr:hypothetical protein [Deltaproteobacteria bacterium]